MGAFFLMDFDILQNLDYLMHNNVLVNPNHLDLSWGYRETSLNIMVTYTIKSTFKRSIVLVTALATTATEGVFIESLFDCYEHGDQPFGDLREECELKAPKGFTVSLNKLDSFSNSASIEYRVEIVVEDKSGGDTAALRFIAAMKVVSKLMDMFNVSSIYLIEPSYQDKSSLISSAIAVGGMEERVGLLKDALIKKLRKPILRENAEYVDISGFLDVYEFYPKYDWLYTKLEDAYNANPEHVAAAAVAKAITIVTKIIDLSGQFCM